MKFLSHKCPFPPVEEADEHGIVAVGGDLSAKRLIEAYSLGIFPWPHPDLPLLWFCPNPRFVLRPKEAIFSRSFKKELKNSKLLIKADTNFTKVMRACKDSKRVNQNGTWITDEMIDAYYKVHQIGLAHSIEAYDGETLVGGLYGVSMGSVFFGESMFFKEANASKICFATLVAHLIDWDFSLIDCQAHTENLERLGARYMERPEFLKELAHGLKAPTNNQPWQLHLSKEKVLSIINAR